MTEPTAADDDDIETIRRRQFLTIALGSAGLAGVGAGVLGTQVLTPEARAPKGAKPGADPDADAEPAAGRSVPVGAQIVFDPEAEPGGNVCTTWKEVVDAIAESRGPHTVVVARDASAAPGSWDMGDGILQFQSLPGRDWFLGGPTLTIPDGCVFEPPPPVVMLDAGVLFLSTSRKPIMSHYARDGAHRMSTCLIATRGGAFASEHHPILYANNWDDQDPPQQVYTTPVPMVAAAVILDQGRMLNGPDGEQVVDEGSSPIIEVDGAVISCNLGPGVAMVTDDIFTGKGEAYYFVNTTAVPYLNIKNPTFEGPERWTLDTKASALGFYPSRLAHWSTPDAPPQNAQAAIDELAARVRALEDRAPG